jgi:hypothetical protein
MNVFELDSPLFQMTGRSVRSGEIWRTTIEQYVLTGRHIFRAELCLSAILNSEAIWPAAPIYNHGWDLTAATFAGANFDILLY